jgi:menaquinone-9 beta-reductase
MTGSEYDVLIVGASIAGCTAAILLAKRGAKVALIDRKKDPNSYKRVCTHYLQPSSVPTIERLGLAPLIDVAGASRPTLEIWTPWGWIFETGQGTPGYSIRREKLDPILRDLAANTAGVDLFLGHSFSKLLEKDGRPVGILTSAEDSTEHEFRGKLVVGADGRQSRVAECAKMRTSIGKNNRAAFYTYYREVPLAKTNVAKAWYANPNVASIFPTDNDVVMISVMPKLEDASAWESDRESKLVRLFEDLPDAPSLRHAKRISPILGTTEMPVIWRQASKPGLALIGDAAFAPDPIWGVGCGWAFQSAEWLVDCVGAELKEPAHLDQALRKYLKLHRWRLAGDALHMANYASGRMFYSLEKFLFSAATKDPVCANRVHAYGHRKIGITGLMSISILARAVKASLTSPRLMKSG